MRVVPRVLVWACLCVATLAAHDVSRRDTSGGSKRVVCYYTNWSVYRPGTAKFNPQNINPYLCTHLIYAFGGLTRENGLRPYDKYQDIEQGGYAKFTGLKTYNKQLKTMLAIGGWNEGSTRFSPLVASVERRGEFVKNVVRFLRQNHFDGLDLDWEYPAFRDGGKARDRENYALLVQELRAEFDRESSKTGRPRLLLTMAVPAGIEYIDKGYDIPKLNKYLDFMNILSYDYHSSFEPSVNHHSPLYPLEEEGEYNFDAQLSIDYTINHYLKLGADRDKLVLGIPTYGRSYTLFNPLATEIGAPADGPGEQGDATREKGYLAYYEICENLQNSDDWKVEKPNSKAMGPYAYKGNQWVGYDDEDIVRKKARYVTEMGLGGIMYWAIDNDDFRGKCHGRPYPLIEAGKEAMLEGSSSSNELIPSLAKGKGRTRARPTTEEPPVRNSGGGNARKPNTKRRRPSSKARAQEKRVSTTPTSTSTSTTPAYIYPAATPEPPTTPDPGSDFKCEDEGFFPHPRDCKKYFWCLDSGPSNLGIVAHQFTCPSGLFFNKAADSCDYTRNVVCNKKTKETTTTTSTAAPKTTSTTSRILRTTTTTTTTTEAPEYDDEYEEYEDEPDQPEEDPKAIKELIDLIKRLGGIENLEKQLHLDDPEKSKSNSVTPPAIISKKLYDRVLSQANSRANSNANFYNPSSKSTTQHTLIFRNRGRQNEGLDHLEEVTALRYEKPQYVTIKRNRPTTPIPEDEEDEEDETEDNVGDIEEEKPRERAYVNIRRDRPTKVSEEATTTPKYVTLRRTRPSAKPEVDDNVTDAPLVGLQNTRSSAALIQELNPVVPKKKYNFAPRTPKRGVLIEPKEIDDKDEVTVASEKEEDVAEIIRVTTEDPNPEVSGSNPKKYVEITRGRGSATVSPIEAELTTVNIPSEPSGTIVDVDVTDPSFYQSTVTDETTSEKKDILPVQTLLTTTSLEPTSTTENVTKKSRFFKSSTSSTRPSIEENENVATETPIATSSRTLASTSSTPRGSIKRNRFFNPSSSVTKPTTEDADSLTLDNSTSTASEDLSAPRTEVKRNRFFRPSANKTQQIGGKIDSFSTNSSTPSSEEGTKRNRFFRPNANKTQLTGAAINSLTVNNISSKTSDSPTSSPDEVTKRSRFFRPRQRTNDQIEQLSIESLFSSITTSDPLSSSFKLQFTDEEKNSLANTNPPSEVSEIIPISTTTPFTPTVTRVVTSVTESGTTERQRISLSKYKGFYLTVGPPSSSTPPPYFETAYQGVTEHSTTIGVLFSNSTDKMEKIMEVNRIKQVTFTDDVAVPFTEAMSGNETTLRPNLEVKSEKTKDKIKEITRLSHITVVDGDQVTPPTLFETDLNSTSLYGSSGVDSTNPNNASEEQTNEISQREQKEQDTTQLPEVSATTPRLLNRGRTRVRVRGSTTRAPIPSGLRTSLQRRRTTLRPDVDEAIEGTDYTNSGRKAFVPRGRGSYRPVLRGSKEGESRNTNESQDNDRKKFRPRSRNDEQNASSDTDEGSSFVPLYKSRVRKKPSVTERTDDYSQEEQTTYEGDSSTNYSEDESETPSRFYSNTEIVNTDTSTKFTPQFRDRSRTKQDTENPDETVSEKELKSSTRSHEETARLFPRLRTTHKADENILEEELKGVTRSQDETAKLFPRLRITPKNYDDIQEGELKSVTRSQEETAKLFPRLRTTPKNDDNIQEEELKSVTRSQEETAKLFPRLRTTPKNDDNIQEEELKSVTRSQEETAKLFPRLRTTQKNEENAQEEELKSVTPSLDETAKLFPLLKTTYQIDNPLQEKEVESHTRSQEDTDKLFPRLRITDQKTSTSKPSRLALPSRNRSRAQNVSKTPEDIKQERISSSTFAETSREEQATSEEASREDSSTERKRGRVVKKKRRRPLSSSSTASSDESGLTTDTLKSSPVEELELKSETFGQREITTPLYTTDSLPDGTTGISLESLTDSNTVFDEEIRSTPTPSESVFTTNDVDGKNVNTTLGKSTPSPSESVLTRVGVDVKSKSTKIVRGRDEVLETQDSSISLDSPRRGTRKFSVDSSEDEESNDVKDDQSLTANFFKKYLQKTSGKNNQGDSSDDYSDTVNGSVEGHAGAKRRRVIKKKRLHVHDDTSTQIEDTGPESLQTEVSPSTTRAPLRRPGGSFLANSRLRTRATSTTSTTTQASTSARTTPSRRRGPSLSSRLNIVRRRKYGDNSSTTELPTSERIVAESTKLTPDAKELDAVTNEPGRKFNFPRRRTKVINRGKAVVTTERIPTTVRPVNDSQNEPSTIEDVQTLEPDENLTADFQATTALPDLANVAVVAIHQLAIQPSIRPFKRDKAIVGTKATYRAQTITLPTTPKISTTVVPAISTTSTPFNPRRGTAFYVTSTAAPILSEIESDPFKPRPFSKITAAVHPNSQSGSLEDYEYYDSEGLLDTMPSAGKVKIHGDGYIECLDQGSFPHPFSCKQFISCAKMENGEVLGWEYTCPRHLSYDPIGGICNWSAGLGCKE